MPILSASKCVLLLSDDALSIYKISGRSVSLIQSFGWRIPDFEGELAAVLNQEVGAGSIYILNDAVEQHYRKEKINKLTAFDRGSIIDRRLNIAFPSYPTRAALELKDKKKRFSASSENLFLFAAVPSTDSLRKLLDAVRRSDCSISSYNLLPIESVDLVEKIAAKLAKENRQAERSTWSILIGQHQAGGLRQIVTKSGQIALTRITPVVMPEAQNAAQWASDVVQEIQSTISYLGRFGYGPSDGLDIILIGKPDFGTLVEDLINIPCQFSSLTLQRAAELAGVSIGKGQEQHFADPLHIGWYAKKARTSLSMKSKEISAIALPRKTAFYAMLLFTAGLAYFAFNLSTEYQALNAAKENLIVVDQMKVEADKIYQDELKRKENLGIDVRLIQGSLAISNDIQQLSFDPIPVLEVVGSELRELRLDKINLAGDLPADLTPSVEGEASVPASKRIVDMTLIFSFPGNIRPEDGNAKLTGLLSRISKRLDSSFRLQMKPLLDLSWRGDFSDETGFTAVKRSASEFYTGQIIITKDITRVADTGAQ